MSEQPELSVVVPAFNEQDNLQPMYERLVKVLGQVVDGLEIVIVDDGSHDATWQRISELAASDSRVRGLRFARNFGHQVAVTAGVDAARGRAVVIIDADLQDPPEVIPEMIELWRQGYEVVYGQRDSRVGETWFKKTTAALFYRFLKALTDVDIPVDTGDFRLMGSRALAAFRALPERNRFIRGLVSWIGFPQTAVRYHRAARHAGETKYPLRKMLRFALDGITSFSALPLRLASWAGLLLIAGGLALIATIIGLRIADIFLPGASWLVVVVLVVSGVQLLSVGTLGEYLARISDEVRQRPLYLIHESSDGTSQVVPPPRTGCGPR
jgi:dolichol-phosphate mannosyltransferase